MGDKIYEANGFHSEFSACIFWDESDAPMALERGSAAAAPLASCSVPMDNWFVYFDQVHTIGFGIKLPRHTVVAVTIGSDTILRDYVQACWQLRQFGEGQKVEVLLVPEIRRLVTNYTARRDSDMFDTVTQQVQVDEKGGL